MIYKGYILDYHVVFDRKLCISDKGYLDETAYLVKKCLMQLPPNISYEDFLKGMMRLTKGTANPQIIREVFEDEASKYF